MWFAHSLGFVVVVLFFFAISPFLSPSLTRSFCSGTNSTALVRLTIACCSHWYWMCKKGRKKKQKERKHNIFAPTKQCAKWHKHPECSQKAKEHASYLVIYIWWQFSTFFMDYPPLFGITRAETLHGDVSRFHSNQINDAKLFDKTKCDGKSTRRNSKEKVNEMEWKRNTSYEIRIEIPRSLTEWDEESERSKCS